MNKVCEIIATIGLMVVFMAAIIPFSSIDKTTVDILYFRGIILGATLISVSIAKLIHNDVLKSLLNAISGGLAALMYYSTRNLFCDCIDIGLYFSFVYEIVVYGFIIITTFRKWIIPSLSKYLTP